MPRGASQRVFCITCRPLLHRSLCSPEPGPWVVGAQPKIRTNGLWVHCQGGIQTLNVPRFMSFHFSQKQRKSRDFWGRSIEVYHWLEFSGPISKVAAAIAKVVRKVRTLDVVDGFGLARCGQSEHHISHTKVCFFKASSQYLASAASNM